ncbi:MAG: hypothetical protein C7B43_18115 [Sulfobacillus benefaciens]|uniref:Uncharacterized protein n=1 Tax=Sulfobacillus benefaciens TaxID=453960 RepID=A0A2T2WRI1_9FIRM|nr:MAG: hypothetical protein C7B43_18115 [Sulfobacillus benefaciens]
MGIFVAYLACCSAIHHRWAMAVIYHTTNFLKPTEDLQHDETWDIRLGHSFGQHYPSRMWH